ncbi:AraC family transcriptional regulator [Alkalihalobacillus alcalophilus ATCC 27647 = CGMCC 1.3604]|uniref:AraC family transcriptional regulator n=1 Tax=Alkalihalobacillus alcalophilus ATCC 27647 = CGMCC 1.3604 TaxID=1218173 RepID=A0A094WJZ1_ALKAL|nr:AraC family transcriptional regulator [Alkalihalobacillus alcalophilus]KGA97166.1 AraC family transcriptional regulator [Alkalihalobacillus alcalophilus ATCC 27647 = CGMCC 1.3604]MED1560902.1 AraC family transcriptional regulator [Alkalihalobacillus alcalophilus]
MEALTNFSSSIEYIESRLQEKIEIEELAKITHFTKFHYQRMFYMLTGVTVAEYIRRRRLTLAAQELLSSKEKVIDVAMKYRYDSPEAFTRAFRKLHGVSPSQVRKNGIKLSAYPKISFQLQIKGAIDMNYQILEKGKMEVVGKSIRISTENGENHQKIPLFWNEFNSDGSSEELEKVCTELGYLGVCLNFDEEQKEFDYMIAVEIRAGEKVPNGYVKEMIPAATWAVFEAVGPAAKAVPEVTGRIFSEWLPSTGYELANKPELEVYPAGDVTAHDYRTEIWMPIVKK